MRASLIATVEERNAITKRIQESANAQPTTVAEFSRKVVQISPIALTLAGMNLPQPLPGPSGQLNTLDGSVNGNNLLKPPHRSLQTTLTGKILPPEMPSQGKTGNRQHRMCRRCGKTTAQGCRGSQDFNLCKSPCRDCGRLDCEGRNTKNFKNAKPCANSRKKTAI